MAWEKRIVTDQNVEFPNRFKIDGVSKTIEPDFGTIVDAGTPINKAYLQPIEDFLEEIDNRQGIISVSENKTLALTDAFKVLNCNNSSDITITIPANDDVEFIVSTEIAIIRNGTGNVSVAPDTGVTLNSDGSKRKIKSQYASAALKKIDTDTWILVGSLTS